MPLNKIRVLANLLYEFIIRVILLVILCKLNQNYSVEFETRTTEPVFDDSISY